MMYQHVEDMIQAIYIEETAFDLRYRGDTLP